MRVVRKATARAPLRTILPVRRLARRIPVHPLASSCILFAQIQKSPNEPTLSYKSCRPHTPQLPSRPSRGTIAAERKTKPTAGGLFAKPGLNLSEGDSYANAICIGDVEWGFEGRQWELQGSSGALSGNYSFGTRFESAPGTNPEELIGAAHAACFSMALAAGLGKNGLNPQKVTTTAAVTIDKVGEGFKITKIKLTCEANVPGADANKFKEIANATKSGCPVSGALSAVPIELDAKLL